HPTRTGLYTLSLHDALPISELLQRHRAPLRLRGRGEDHPGPLPGGPEGGGGGGGAGRAGGRGGALRAEGAHPRAARRVEGIGREDRKSTRLNSSHVSISYAV